MIIVLAALAAGPAQAWVSISAICDGDTMSVDVVLTHAAAWGIAEMNVKWASADEPTHQEFVLAQSLAVAATNDEQRFDIRVAAPMLERLLIYSTYFTNADGGVVAGADPGCSWTSTYAICGELFLFRARIYDFGQGDGLLFNYCDSQSYECGGFDPVIHSVSDWHSYVNTGRLVNAYGAPGALQFPPCAMPGWGCPVVTRMEFEDDPAGCFAVETENMTWGALKSAFR